MSTKQLGKALFTVSQFAMLNLSSWMSPNCFQMQHFHHEPPPLPFLLPKKNSTDKINIKNKLSREGLIIQNLMRTWVNWHVSAHVYINLWSQSAFILAINNTVLYSFHKNIHYWWSDLMSKVLSCLKCELWSCRQYMWCTPCCCSCLGMLYKEL